MEVETLAAAPPRDPGHWSAAQDLQKSLFIELFRAAGFAEAFSTGEQALDALAHSVLEQIADEVARSDPSLAEAFYKQLSD